MKILTRRREQEIVAYIQQARQDYEELIEAKDALVEAQHAIIETKDAMLTEAVKHISGLEIAIKEAVRIQRDIAYAFLRSREDPDADIEWDLEGLLEGLNDQLAQFEEHVVD